MVFSTFLFLAILLFSTFLSLSMNNMLVAWLVLELGVVSFIPLMTLEKSFPMLSGSWKYFVIQASSSGLFVISAISMNHPNSLGFFEPEVFWASFFVVVSMVVKLGMFPFFNWAVEIGGCLSWFSFSIFNTLIKIPPFFILLFILESEKSVLIWMIVFSSSIFSLACFLENSIRAILIYSGLLNLSWAMSSCKLSIFFSTEYLIFYFFSLVFCVKIFSMEKKSKVTELLFSTEMSGVEKLIKIFAFASLSGIPPFTMFFPKLEVLFLLSEGSHIFSMFLLLFISTLIMFIYLPFFFSTTFLSSWGVATTGNSLMSKLFINLILLFSLSSFLISFF
nr:NADH dehydrogenase subunit 2 [Oxylipeurus chiniri]